VAESAKTCYARRSEVQVQLDIPWRSGYFVEKRKISSGKE
jgi:hypothetical protein